MPVEQATALDRFCAATMTNDIEVMMSALSPTAQLISPVSGRMVFSGHGDLAVLLSAVYGTLTAVRWTEIVGDGATRVVLGAAKIGPVALTDAMVVELDAAGLITKISPHVRPWPALTLVAVSLGPKLARHPRVVARALGSPRA